MFQLLRRAVRRILPYESWMAAKWLRANPYHGTDSEWKKEFYPGQGYVGILYDIAQEHQFYINACHELRINYEVIDIRHSDWIARISASPCNVYLVWPTIYKPIQKQFWDERLQVLSHSLGKKVYPSVDILSLYESKRKTRDWLLANSLQHPRTYVFFDQCEARESIQHFDFPIICKTDQGAASSGVYVVRNRRDAMRLTNKAFGAGISLKNRGRYDRHAGYIIFQEYLPNCKEWRIIRVGDSYFCRYKLKRGDFHSGSGDIVWAQPPKQLLETTRTVSEKFEVPNINVDFFETEDGRFLINEIHALWGGKVIEDPDLEGRYLYEENTGEWRFEKGDFFRNRCANLRLEWLRQNKWI